MELNSQTGPPSPGQAADPFLGTLVAQNPYKSCFKLHFGASTWVAPWPTPAKDFPQAQAPGGPPFGDHFAQNPYKTCVKMNFGVIFMGRALAGPLKGFFLNEGFF